MVYPKPWEIYKRICDVDIITTEPKIRALTQLDLVVPSQLEARGQKPGSMTSHSRPLALGKMQAKSVKISRLQMFQEENTSLLGGFWAYQTCSPNLLTFPMHLQLTLAWSHTAMKSARIIRLYSIHFNPMIFPKYCGWKISCTTKRMVETVETLAIMG